MNSGKTNNRNKIEIVPFTEFNSTLSKYNSSNQLQAKQYKQLIESTLDQAIYERQNSFNGALASTPLNANIPRFNKVTNYRIQDKSVPIYKEFWQFKQPGATIFTDWESAGVQNVKTDMSIRQMPFQGNNTLTPHQNSNLVLSNINNTRNNLQRYGKEFLTNTNLLNSEAFLNGVSYESGNANTYRSGLSYDNNRILHSNFGNGEQGDLYQKTQDALRVDLPSNFVNTNLTSWQYINPAYVIPNPNPKLKIYHEKLKHGILTLDAMKLTGISCLTADYGIIPDGFKHPPKNGNLNDQLDFPPVNEPYYYQRPGTQFMIKDGDELPNGKIFMSPGRNLYCSPNTNFVTMPLNHLPSLKGLDTSLQVAPGTNSVTLGTVMSPRLKEFINRKLYNINLALIVIELFANEIKSNRGGDSEKAKLLRNFKPELFTDTYNHKSHIKFKDYANISAEQQYKYLYNVQRTLSVEYGHIPDVEAFILNLSVFKFGGYHHLSNTFGHVQCSELNQALNIDENDNIEFGPRSGGVFLLLPTMLSEDLFIVRDEIPSINTGNVKDSDDIGGNNCISHGEPRAVNQTNCAYRDTSGLWQQVTKPGERRASYVPNVPNPGSENLNDSIYNGVNFSVGTNPYNVPNTF